MSSSLLCAPEGNPLLSDRIAPTPHGSVFKLQNDTEELETRVLILELEMDTVQAEVLILHDDILELRNQDSLTDLRLVIVEEDIAGITL